VRKKGEEGGWPTFAVLQRWELMQPASGCSILAADFIVPTFTKNKVSQPACSTGSQ
jgi:hypothetical protein